MIRVRGSGSMYKLSDVKRRRPWIATVTYHDDDGFSRRKLIGSFATKREATEALDAFIVSPIDVRALTLTFRDVFDMFFREYSQHCSASTAKLRMISFRQVSELHDRIFYEIKAADLQRVLDHLDKGTPTLESIRAMFGQLWKFATANDYCRKDITLTLRVPKRDDKVVKRPHAPYTDEEIALLWQHQDDDMAALQLILIYCGCRISEIIELRREDIDLKAGSFLIRHAKTRAGIRTVPIADKALPLWQKFMSRGGDVLIVSEYGNAIPYQRIRTYWDRYNKDLGIDRMPHDCRHTAITKMTAAGVDARIIKKIV